MPWPGCNGVSSIDTVGRLGDDEFVILLEELPSRNVGIEEIGKLKASLNRSLTLENLAITPSAQAWACSANDYVSPRLPAGRQHRPAQRPERRAGPAAHLLPEQDKAIKKLDYRPAPQPSFQDNEFSVALQPIYFMGQTPILTGFGPLMRWKTKDRGWISPGEFIPIAETGLLPLGHGFWSNPAKILSSWARAIGNELSISVNLSARQFPARTWFPTWSSASADTRSLRPVSNLKSRKATS